ncbi:MAG TPA: response regulator [Bryobacteraceae bacterium]|nr:response regulator [Bryobacteraceae bacterium]
MGTILIVDDDPAVYEFVAAAVRAMGLEAVCAANGWEGLAKFQASPGRFDLVLTDVIMPFMDGNEMIRRIRRLRPDIRIICMTGTPGCVTEAVSVLYKPFQYSSLAASIRGCYAA